MTGTAPSQPVLSTHGLTKHFGALVAVDGLDIQVQQGDVYGFLGPNGAGKTTVIRMILGLVRPSAGHVEVMGRRVPGEREAALRHIGGFVDDPVFYPTMTARRNLWLLGQMSGGASRERIDEVLELVGLADRARSKVGGFSHGMKQRLGIAQALLHRPDLVVLDEPTSGLDPGGMRDVRELIRALGRQGTTVFLSSHLLHEVELACTRAAIVNHGHVVVEGPVADLRPQGMAVKLMVDDHTRAAEVVAQLPGAPPFLLEGDHLVVTMPDDQVPDLVRGLVAADVAVRAVVPAPERGLEDVFLELMGEDEVARPSGGSTAARPRRGGALLYRWRRDGARQSPVTGGGPAGATPGGEAESEPGGRA